MLRRTLAVDAARDRIAEDRLEAFADADAASARAIFPCDSIGNQCALPATEHRAWLLAALEDAFNLRHDSPALCSGELMQMGQNSTRCPSNGYEIFMLVSSRAGPQVVMQPTCDSAAVSVC